jgi:hypothetical protein
MKNYLKSFSIGFVVGIIVYFLVANFFTGNNYAAGSSISEIRIKREKEELNLKIEWDALLKRNDRLVNEVKSSQSRLKDANKRNIILKKQLFDLIDNNSISTLDTFGKLENCDSLAERVDDLVILNDYKDSINQHIITTLEEQMANKDEAIGLSSKQNHLLRQTLDSSLANQVRLHTEIKQLEKSAHRSKRNSKICKGLLVIASGFVINQILQR